MKRSLSLWQFAGFVFTSVVGTLLHFAYEWSGESVFLAPFSAVNESIWEHMKLLFFPLVIFALWQGHFFEKEYPSYWCVKLFGTLLGIGLIPVLYYTYTGIFGVSVDSVNITIFFVVAAIVYLLETRWLRDRKTGTLSKRFVWLIFLALTILFAVFTFYPPSIPLFVDPQATKQPYA